MHHVLRSPAISVAPASGLRGVAVGVAQGAGEHGGDLVGGLRQLLRRRLSLARGQATGVLDDLSAANGPYGGADISSGTRQGR